MFVNNALYELFSLPKIIGSVSGGIVITKNLKYYKFAKKEQHQNKSLGQYQSKLKFDEVNKKKSFHNWTYHESTNTFLEYNSLLNIKDNLKNFEKNKKIISERQKYFKKNINKRFKFERLGPIIPIDYRLIKNHNLMNKHFLVRRIHKERNKIDMFKEIYLLPVHFKITDKKFQFYIDIIKKSL